MNLFASPSASEWLRFASIFISIGLFIVVGEYLRKQWNGSPEITRKSVHILTGLLIYFAPQLFVSGIPPLMLAVSFMTVNYAAIRFGLLKGMHGTNRVSYGTVYYPLSFLLLVLLFWDTAPQVISISILILALGDAAAAIVGENLRRPHEYYLTSDKKSFEGSLVMFGTTFLVVQFGLWHFGGNRSFSDSAQIGLAVALVATAWEAISSKGFDNLTVPIGSSLMLLYFLTPMPRHEPEGMFYGVIFGSGVAAVSLYLRFLSPSGSIAVFLLAVTIFGMGGWIWSVPILFFFVTSSLLSKYEKSTKKKFEMVFEKTDKRDEGQVAANGGTAGILVILWFLFPERTEMFYLYLATIAAVTADTWGTEIGILGKGNPVSIASFKRVNPGTSGGVSLIGFIGGFAGAALVVLSGWMVYPETLSNTVAAKIIAAGVAGALVDSILGATIQAQYRTPDGKLIEKNVYHGAPAELVKGFRRIDNDFVNWMCALAAPLFLMLIL